MIIIEKHLICTSIDKFMVFLEKKQNKQKNSALM